MRNCDNYYFNIDRALDACPFIDDVHLKKGLADYLYEIEADLNCINIDDIVVNAISFIDRDEYEEMSEYKKEGLYILAKTDEGYWVI